MKEPPPGFWQREASHNPRPLTPLGASLFLDGINQSWGALFGAPAPPRPAFHFAFAVHLHVCLCLYLRPHASAARLPSAGRTRAPGLPALGELPARSASASASAPHTHLSENGAAYAYDVRCKLQYCMRARLTCESSVCSGSRARDSRAQRRLHVADERSAVAPS